MKWNLVKTYLTILKTDPRYYNVEYFFYQNPYLKTIPLGVKLVIFNFYLHIIKNDGNRECKIKFGYLDIVMEICCDHTGNRYEMVIFSKETKGTTRFTLLIM